MIDRARLAPLDFGLRLDRVRSVLADQQLAAVVVTDPVSLRWLTGFTGSNGVAFIGGDTLVLVTDGRYGDQAPAELEAAGVSADVKITNTPVDVLGSLVDGEPVAVESDQVTWADYERYSVAFGQAPVALSVPLVALRAVKDRGEVDRVRAAASIADAALAEVAQGFVGSTERSIALRLDSLMRAHGATTSAYETIVASGPNAALPHARPTDRKIVPGDLVIVDVGALYEGYRSDMTRTFVVDTPSTKQGEWLEVVLAAQRAGAEILAPGVAARDVDAACRAVIADAGLGDHFTHGTGHGVGLDIHEHPRVNSRSEDTIVEGMLVTVEPGVYVAPLGGVRWEDLHVVTAHGAEAVTLSPKEPITT
jgi:Xaa-Pro aminopeptidase